MLVECAASIVHMGGLPVQPVAALTPPLCLLVFCAFNLAKNRALCNAGVAQCDDYTLIFLLPLQRAGHARVLLALSRLHADIV